MDADELLKTLKQIQGADVIWAEVRGGKLDGKFIPFWIAPQVVAQLNGTSEGQSLSAAVHRIVIAEVSVAELIRLNVLKVKGPSAVWPAGLTFHSGPHGSFIARFEVS
jgi:hypothetical protein